MATPGDNRGWRAGRKGARKKSAKPNVAGIIIALLLLFGVLVWAIWPHPVADVYFLVLQGDTSAARDENLGVRNATAVADQVEVAAVFSKLAEQVPYVRGASSLSYSELKTLPSAEIVGKGGIVVAYLNAMVNVNPAEEPPNLLLHFGLERDSFSFAEFIETLIDAGPKEIVLLLEISQERPDWMGGRLANDGPALVQEAVAKLRENHPELKLSVITSTASLHDSYPYMSTAQGDVTGEDGKVETSIYGSAFGHAVAELFRSGEVRTVSDLHAQLQSKVAKYVEETFRGVQVPQFYSTYEPNPEEPVEIFHESQSIAVAEPAESSEGESAEEASPEKSKEEGAEPKELTPAEQLAELRGQVDQLIRQPGKQTVKIGEYRELVALVSFAQYCLDHDQVDAFLDTFDQGKRRLQQIQSSVDSSTETQAEQDLVAWVQPVDLTLSEDSTFFDDLLLLVNDGDERRSPQLLEMSRSPDFAQKLTASFLAFCRKMLTDVQDPSPDAAARWEGSLQNLKAAIPRLTKKSGWSDADWPHQVILADDLMRNGPVDWDANQAAAFCRLLLLRSEAMQLAGGWQRNGVDRVEKAAFRSIQNNLDQLLKSSLAAERWFMMGQKGAGLVEQYLTQAEKSFNAAQEQLQNERRRLEFFDRHRLSVLEVVKLIALEHDAILLTPREVDSLSKLEVAQLINFVPEYFPQASFSGAVTRQRVADLLQLTNALDENTPQQVVRNTEVALSRLNGAGSSAPKIRDEFVRNPVHQGIWLGFWSIRCLQAIDGELEATPLFLAWKELVTAISKGDDVSLGVVAAKRERLTQLLAEAWDQVGEKPLFEFEFPEQQSVQKLVGTDLHLHAQRAGGRYVGRLAGVVNKLRAGTDPARLRVRDAELLLQGDVCQLQLDAKAGTQVYFWSEGLRLEQSGIENVQGWQRVSTVGNELTLQATPQFSGTAEAVLAAVNEFGIIEDLQRVPVRAKFEVQGWNLRFRSGTIALNETDFANEGALQKLIELPPNTGDAPLPLTVELVRPEGAFVDTVLVNIAPLKENGDPEAMLWPAFQKLSLGNETRAVPLPLVPLPPEGAEAPAEAAQNPLKFSLSNGMAVFVRPEDRKEGTADVVLKVFPRFVDPVTDYVEISEPQYDRSKDQFSVGLKRRSGIPPRVFPPQAIEAEMSFSRKLDRYRIGAPTEPPPKSPEILEGAEQKMVVTFSPQIYDALRDTDAGGSAEGMEIGLSLAGMDDAIKWRLGRSLEFERIGYRRNQGFSDAGDAVEIRLGMDVQNSPEDGVLTHDLNGDLVLDGNWRKARLNLPVQIFGLRVQSVTPKFLELQTKLYKGGSSEPTLLPPQRVRDAYDREVTASPGEGTEWLISTRSRSYGSYDVNLAENYTFPEGRHRLEATLIDLNLREVALYETTLVFEGSAPKVIPRAANAKQTLVTQNYVGEVLVHDPQTGIAAVRVGLAEDALVDVPLKNEQGSFREFPVKFEVDKANFPELEVKDKDVRQQVELIVVVENGVGKTTQLKQKISVVQPAMNMNDSNSPKVGNVLVKFGSRSAFDVVMKGPAGEESRMKVEDSVEFKDLPEGQYTFEWKRHFPTKSDTKTVPVKFAKNGETATVTIP